MESLRKEEKSQEEVKPDLKKSSDYKPVETDDEKDKVTVDNGEIELVVDAFTSIKESDTKGIGNDKINRSLMTLTDITFNITKGSLVAVVGPVGSGKSSFLSALLGEMHLKCGDVRVAGSIAYCDQRPWILNDTVVGNITFGLPLDEGRFDNALFSANLEDDINVLPGGIQTQIGERGINLSGGQKARVALARAVYRDADVYLLDDPLSAVDAHVGQFLFHECIKTTLKDKTRVLVTHQVHLLPYVDHIIVMRDGSIYAAGSYDDLMSSGIDLTALLPGNSSPTAEEMKPSVVEESKIEDENTETKEPLGTSTSTPSESM